MLALTARRTAKLLVVAALIASVFAVWFVAARPHREVRLADTVCLGVGGSNADPIACIPV